jgi:hypothetical protein
MALAAVKNIHDDASAWGSYLGVLLGAAAVAGAWSAYSQASAEPPPAAAPPAADIV